MIKLPSIFIQNGSISYTLKFVCTENCVGEVLIAELFSTNMVEDIEEIEVLYTVSTGSEDGRNKGDLIEMELDFTSVESGNYYCKIYTNETGVLAKAIVKVQ